MCAICTSGGESAKKSRMAVGRRLAAAGAAAAAVTWLVSEVEVQEAEDGSVGDEVGENGDVS